MSLVLGHLSFVISRYGGVYGYSKLSHIGGISTCRTIVGRDLEVCQMLGSIGTRYDRQKRETTFCVGNLTMWETIRGHEFTLQVNTPLPVHVKFAIELHRKQNSRSVRKYVIPENGYRHLYVRTAYS